jgi:hypothetical protein
MDWDLGLWSIVLTVDLHCTFPEDLSELLLIKICESIPSAASSFITGISLLSDPQLDGSDLADILDDRVIRGLVVIGVIKLPFELVPFSASGLDGHADVLRRFLPRPPTLPSCPPFLVRFLLPSLGVFLLLDLVVIFV